MNILQTLKQLRDDLKTWVTNNLNVINTKLNNKVDREAGKGLSTNDFTNDYKTKLDNIGESGSGGISVETDPTVPGWAKEPTKPTYTAAEVGALPDTTPLFSGDYNDLDNAPNITEDSAGDLIILDKSGNIIFKVDANGIHATAATINDEAIATQEWVNGVIAGKVDYLGTVSSFYEMTSSAPNLQPNPGDYWRANAEFTHIETNEIIHSGDLLIYTGGDNFVDVIHTEDPGNYVTLNTEQNISAKKTFKNFKANNALEIFYSENLNGGPIATINSQQFRITTPIGKFNEIGIDGLAASIPGGSVTTLYSFDGIRPYQGGVLEFPSDIVDTEKIATQEWVNAQNFGSENVDTSDFVSKSATSQQTLQSGLNFQNGGVLNIFGSNNTPVIFDRERIRYITPDGSGELNYFFNPEDGGINTIATRGYVDEKIAELRTELKAYIDEAILGGKW